MNIYLTAKKIEPRQHEKKLIFIIVLIEFFPVQVGTYATVLNHQPLNKFFENIN